MVCASVREDNPRALSEWNIARTDAKPYNNLLISPARISTLRDIKR